MPVREALHKSSSLPTPTTLKSSNLQKSHPVLSQAPHDPNSRAEDVGKVPPLLGAIEKKASVRDDMKVNFMNNLSRSQSAPEVVKLGSKKSSRSLKKGQSSRRTANALIGEVDLWERYFDEDWVDEPDWKLLLTGKLRRTIKHALTPKDRKKHSNTACEYSLNHWLHMKKLQVDAIHNKLGIKEHNLVEMDADLMLVSPTFDEYVDALVTICKMKSGGVWDMDQKVGLLVGVYGRTKVGHLNRDEFAELLQKHAKVKPPPKPPTFETEDEQIEYERKVKRGEIVVPKHMDQKEYEIFLYRWLKKEFSMWEKVQGGYVTTDTAIKGMESNTHLEDYFSIDLWALLNDLEANDDAAAERLKYISIAEKAYQKYQEQLEKIAPEKTDKRKEEMQRELHEMTTNIGKGTGTAQKSKSKKAGRKKA